MYFLPPPFQLRTNPVPNFQENNSSNALTGNPKRARITTVSNGFDESGRLAQSVEHCLREAGAGGSNPLTPTIFFNRLAANPHIQIQALMHHLAHYRPMFMHSRPYPNSRRGPARLEKSICRQFHRRNSKLLPGAENRGVKR